VSETVLVTGASGRVGRQICQRLSDEGRRVRALVHRRPVDTVDEAAHGDLLRPESLEQACAGVDAVLHLAALTHARDPARYGAVNLDGTANLLAASARAGVSRFVYVSTRAVSRQGGAYSRSKLSAEELVTASALNYVIVRLPELFGAGGSEGVDRIVDAARRGKPILVVGKGSEEICPAHVDDVLPALVAAVSAEQALGKTYTLAGPCLPTRSFALACIEAFASRSRIFGLPLPLVRGATALARFVPLPVYPDQLTRLLVAKPPATAEAAEDLGFAPRDLASGLRAVATSESHIGRQGSH
jgi:nucleoside-diphosphate-sugar epimerase